MWTSLRSIPLLLALFPHAPALSQERVLLQGERSLSIVSETGETEWEMPWARAKELHVRPNGNLIVLQDYGEIVEIERRTKSVVWSLNKVQDLRQAESRLHPHSCLALANGNLLIATNNPPRIVELDRLGVVQRERQLPEGKDEGLATWRIAQVLENGNLLLSDYQPGTAQEFDWGSEGALWQSDLLNEDLDVEAPSLLCTAALRLDDEHTLLALANKTQVALLDSKNQRLWSLDEGALVGHVKGRITHAQLMENGHVALSHRQRNGGTLLLLDLDPKTKRITPLGEFPIPPTLSDAAAYVLSTGPQAELLARAQRIHRDTLTLDTHKDISVTLASPEYPEDPVEAVDARLSQDPTLWGTNQVDFPKMRAGGLDVAFYIVYVGQAALDEEGFARARATALEKFETIERMAARYPEHIEIAKSPDDVLRIAESGKLVACIGIENGYAMGQDLSAIEEFHGRGARYMSITHNRHSQLGDSNTPADEPLHGGLSDLGRRAIEEMNRVGIMVDISHAGEETTMQAIAHSKAPVIASHSSVDGVFEHGRNLSDRELLALKENGGVIQIVAFATYVRGDEERDAFVEKTRAELGLDGSDTSNQRNLRQQLRERVRAFDSTREKSAVTHVADHIDYAVKLIGIDHVAISSDFDGGGGVEGWNDASETFNVTLELVRRGYSAEDIGKLWSGNTLRVWREVERIASEL